MGTLFQLTNNSIIPDPGTRIIHADEYATMLEGRDIIDAARQRASKILEEAEKIYEERKQQGYDDGILEGRMQQSEKIIETAEQIVEYFEKIEETIVRIVNSAIRKIIGDMDDQEKIIRIVRTALDAAKDMQKATLRVSPEDEPILRKDLAAMLSSGNGMGYLNIESDPHMKRGDCILQSEIGIVDASIETQLKAIEKALMSKIKDN